MDSVYLITYALGNYASGILGDNWRLKYMICGGMSLTTAGYALLAVLGLGEVKLPWLFMIIFAFIGVFQSTVWPGTVTVMGN